MIKLKELQVTPQGITLEKVHKYYDNNIYNNHKEFNASNPGWKEYKEICKPYCKKYNIYNWVGYYDFEQLSQSNLS